MNVELLYFDSCPNYEALLARVRQILRREEVKTDVHLWRIETDEEATDALFLGSPTVRVDGSDIEAAAAARRDFGLKCRLYRTPDGLQGAPPDDWIDAAIRDRTRRDEHQSLDGCGCRA